MLALSSLSRNSRYVALLWLGMWIRHEHRVGDPRSSRTASNGCTSRGACGACRASEEFVEREIEAAKTDWRPLVSYTANLSPDRRASAGDRMPRGSSSASCRPPASADPISAADAGLAVSVVLVGRRAGRHCSDFPHAFSISRIKSLDRLK